MGKSSSFLKYFLQLLLPDTPNAHEDGKISKGCSGGFQSQDVLMGGLMNVHENCLSHTDTTAFSKTQL